MKARLLLVSVFLVSIVLLGLLRPGGALPLAAANGAQPRTASQASGATPTMAEYLPIVVHDNPATRSPSPSATLTPSPSATLTPSPSATSTPSPSATSTPAPQIPAFSHVFIIVMENSMYEEIPGNPRAPYLNSLMQQYVVATNYYGIGHPSVQNYIALVGGDTFGITTNCTTCLVNAPNL